MFVPRPRALNKRVAGLLFAFYDEPDRDTLNEALRLYADRFKLAVPKIIWCRPNRIDGGRSWGQAHLYGETGATIRLIHPTRWKARNVGTADRWVAIVAHELGHWVDEYDSERWADRFSAQMLEDYL